MSKYTAAKAREKFSDVINRAAYGKETIIITRNGKDAAAIIPAEALKFLIEAEDELDVKEARQSLKEAKTRGTTAWRKIKSDLKLKNK